MRTTIAKLAHLVQAGYQFRGRVEPDPDGRIAVVQVKDMKDAGQLKRDDLVRVSLDRDVSPYLLESGDVLFLSRGHRVFATALAEVPPATIVPNYIYIVRPDPAVVLPAYLAWFINSPMGQAQLKLVHAGSHMPIVAKSDFERLEIDVPPIATQRTIVALADLARREQQLLQELREAKQQLIDRVCTQAATRPNSKGKVQ